MKESDTRPWWSLPPPPHRTLTLLCGVSSYGELGVLARPKLQPRTTAGFVKL